MGITRPTGPKIFQRKIVRGRDGGVAIHVHIYIYTYAGMLVKVIKSVCRVRLLHYDQYMF